MNYKLFEYEINYLNTGLVSREASITSWREGDHPSSDGVTIKIPYGVDVLLHRPALHPIYSCWVG